MSLSDADRVKLAYFAEDGEFRVWGKTVFNQLQAQVAYTEFAFREHLYDLLRQHGWLTSPLIERRVLEIGCGWGRNFPLFLDIGVPTKHITGVDLLTPMIERAKANYPDAQLRSGDVATMTDLHGQHDLVLLHTTMSAVLDAQVHHQLLGAAADCLRPGGLLAIMDIVESYKEGRVKAGEIEITFIRPVSRHRIRSELRAFGLQEVRNVEFGLKPRLRNGIFGRIGRWVRHPILLRWLADAIHALPGAPSHYLVAWKKG